MPGKHLLICVLFGVISGCSHQKPRVEREQPAMEAPEPERELVVVTVAREAPAPKPCPDEMTLAGGSCIDRWEAITVLPDGKVHSPYHPVGAETVHAESREGWVPQAHISMEQADQACTRSGKHLCSTAEWVDACRGAGPSKRTYPWGNEKRVGACNTEQGGSAHPLMALYGGSPKRDSWTMNDSRINQLASTVAPAGAFGACVTPDGASDLVGNLLEWTRGDKPLLMGGHYLDATENGDGCRYVTLRHGPKYFDFTTGFRCCKKPDAVPTNTATDPAGYRSFTSPAAALPPRPAAPAYAADAACPVDMEKVEGARCLNPIQECKRWLVVPGQQPERSCAEFAPTRCTGGHQNLRYCIDRYEYTPKGWELPLVHVSWSEAQTICRAEEKRLCREEEWEFACEGPEAFPYPYGYVRDGAACNHDLDELFDPRGKLRDQRVAGDSRPRCKSPFGVFNLVGNVDEWTTRSGNEPPWRSILRGGWWLTGRNRCRAATESHNEIYAGPQTSFRCCKEARK
jgi:sulfatase modifying factor 1